MPVQPYNRVLFIAPSDSGMDVAPEADALSELGYTVRVIQGDVSAERIFAVVRLSKWAIVHYAGDSTPIGFILTGGKVLDIDSMLQIAKMAGCELVFINGCSSAVVGQTLIDEGVPVAIVAMRELPDNIAKQTSQAFYKSLAETGNLHSAYKDSKPASRGLYQWLSDGGYTANVIEPVMKKLTKLEQIVATNDTDHNDIRAAISGLQVSIFSATAMKRYFLRITIIGWVVMGMAFALFTGISKAMK